MGWSRGIVMALFAVTLTAPAFAQRKKETRVRAHKAKAFDLFEKGDYAAGIAEMEKANALIPHPGFVLNIAVAYDRWNRCKESLETFERFFLECDRCGLLPEGQQKQAEVAKRCRVPVEIVSEPPGAHVAIDGAVRGRTPFETVLLPGSYAIVLDLSGHERAMETLVVEKGVPKALSLVLAKKPAPPPPPPPPPQVVVTEPATGPSPATWVGFGVGAAGVIVGATFTGLTMKALGDEEDARAAPRPKPEIVALQQDARRNAIIANVGFGVGAAGLLTGLLLYFLTDTPSTEVAVAPVFGPGLVGLSGSFE